MKFARWTNDCEACWRPAKLRVWESAPGDPFWDYGYPRNAGEELTADLKAEGLTE